MSIRLGQKNEKGAEQFLANCFLMLTVMALVLTVLYWACGKSCSGGLVPGEDDLSLCTVLYDHLSVRNLFCADDDGHEPVYHLPGLCKGGYEAVMIGAVANIVLDPIFYFRPAS